MREIRFRAWDKTEKCMVSWSYLLSIQYGDNRIIDKDVADSFFNDPDFCLMQYTGLKDKNGREIYEGDILKTNNRTIRTVVFEWGCFDAVNDYTDEPVGSFLESAIEVIGNLYENPELLQNVNRSDNLPTESNEK